MPQFVITARQVLLPVLVTRKHQDNYGNTLISFVSDLRTQDFQVLADGEEARVTRAAVNFWPVWEVFDNNGTFHCDAAFESGIWDSPDFALAMTSTKGCDYEYRFYLLVFTPPDGLSGTCHKIAVKVRRPFVSVSSREEYCEGSTPNDPLGGSKFGDELLQHALSGDAKTIALSGHAGLLMSEAHRVVVDVAVRIPDDALDARWDGKSISATVGLVGMFRKPAGDLVSRFSDTGVAFKDYDSARLVGYSDAPQSMISFFQREASSVRYERQFDLPDGAYTLKLAIANDKKFGSLEVPVAIEQQAPDGVWLSDLFFCHRFHNPSDAPKELEHRPASYVPLMSQGMEFTPSGSAVMKKGERLFAWFQLDPPPRSKAGSERTMFRLKVMSVRTGKLEADSGLQEAGAYRMPGSSLMNVAKEIGFEKLSPGDYTVTVEAVDSAGAVVAEKSANFLVN